MIFLYGWDFFLTFSIFDDNATPGASEVGELLLVKLLGDLLKFSGFFQFVSINNNEKRKPYKISICEQLLFNEGLSFLASLIFLRLSILHTDSGSD